MEEINKQAIRAALVLSLVITAVALCFYFSDPAHKLGRQVAVVKESETDDIEKKTDNANADTIKSTTGFTKPAEKPAEEKPASSADGWKTYAGSQGISFDYPEQVSGTDCSGKSGVAVPLKAFEDSATGTVYLTAGCSDTLEAVRKKSVQVSAAQDNYRQEKIAGAWSISVASIKNESELDSFINKHYGTGGCEAGERQLVSGKDDVYAVTIYGKDWENPGDRLTDSKTCKVDYAYKILYAPDKSKAVSVVLGQGCTFTPADKLADCYELEDKMIASIRFD